MRAAARSVAEQMSSAPFARDSYFVGNRFDVPHDLHAVIPGSIWECMAAWGAFWEETPEDCLALYRRMMTSPAFCYIHKALWLRSLDSPRLTAWNDSDRARVDLVWKQFTQELGASTNVLCRLEAKALAAADAETPADTAKAINELFAAMLQNREAFLTNNVNLLYLNWQAPSLAYAKLGPMTPEIRKSSQALAALHDEWERAGADRAFQAVFEKQKDYLKQNTPCDFSPLPTSSAPAAIPKPKPWSAGPLVEAYRSNLFARAATAAGVEHGQWKNAASLVGFVEGDLDRILAPTQPGPASQPPPQPSGPAVAATKPPPPVGASVAPPALTNIFTVDRFLPVPLDRLAHDLSAATITACHWQEGRLVLDLACSAFSFSSEATAPELRPAIAVLDPEAGQWSVVAGPGVSERTSMMTGNRFYHRTALCGGQLFTSQYKQVKQYDPATRSSRILDVPGGENCELFAVNGRLFAANRSMIMEILDHGQGTRVLASNRRRPPASALDAADLGTPTLFEGSGHSLRACTANKISTWIDGDWREASPAPPATLPPVIGPDGLLFVADGWNLPWCVSRLTAGSNAFEFCMGTLHRPNPPPLRGVPGPGLRRPLPPRCLSRSKPGLEPPSRPFQREIFPSRAAVRSSTCSPTTRLPRKSSIQPSVSSPANGPFRRMVTTLPYSASPRTAPPPIASGFSLTPPTPPCPSAASIPSPACLAPKLRGPGCSLPTTSFSSPRSSLAAASTARTSNTSPSKSVSGASRPLNSTARFPPGPAGPSRNSGATALIRMSYARQTRPVGESLLARPKRYASPWPAPLRAAPPGGPLFGFFECGWWDRMAHAHSDSASRGGRGDYR